MNKIQEFLPYKSFKLLYSANSTTYSPSNFHDACDNKTNSTNLPTLTIYKTTNGTILLGYNHDGWLSYGGFTPSAYGSSWISLLKGGNLGTNEPKRYFNKSNLNKSFYNDYYSGPQFGSSELRIKDDKVVSSSIHIYNSSSGLQSNNPTYGYDSKLNIQDIDDILLFGRYSNGDIFSLLPSGSEPLDSIEVFQVLDDMVRIYDWQKQSNKIVRVKGDSGAIQCFAKTLEDKNAQKCDEITTMSDFNKLTSKEIFMIDCKETDIKNNNHWCSQVSKEFNKDSTNINYDVCPVEWRVVNDANHPDQILCYPPNGRNPLSLKRDSIEMKRSRTDARFPYKYDYTSSFLNDDLRTNIRKNVSNVLGTSTTPVQVNLDRFNFNKNGVMINVFTLNANNTPPRGGKITTEMITTAINFNWGDGPIFRRMDNVYIEFITYVFIPTGVKTVRFSLKGDTQARLSIATDGTFKLKTLLDWSSDANISDPIKVKEKTYLPIIVDYFRRDRTKPANISLSWSLDDGPIQIISRDNYFLSKEQCSTLDAIGNAVIPLAKNCEGLSCDIKGQRCLVGTPGAGNDNWICKDKKWVIEPK